MKKSVNLLLIGLLVLVVGCQPKITAKKLSKSERQVIYLAVTDSQDKGLSESLAYKAAAKRSGVSVGRIENIVIGRRKKGGLLLS